MRSVVPVLLALVLLSSAAGAQENPARPAGPVQVEVLVLGGGKTPEEAEAWLARWKAAAPLLEKVITLAEGFPQVRQSAKVPGLNPGFHIVVLGFCPAAAREGPHTLLKSFFPGTYAKAVLTQDEGCPEPVAEAAAFNTHTVKKDDLRLTAVQVDSKEETGVYVALFRGDTLLDSKVESYGPTEGAFPQSCNVALTGTKARATSEVSCTIEAPACTNYVDRYSQRTSYSIGEGKLVTTTKELESHTVGFCD